MPAPKQGDVAVASQQSTIRPAPSNVIAQAPQVQASQALQRAIAGPIAALKRADILALQRTIGNRAVRQLLAAAPLQRQSPEEEDDEVQRKSVPGGATALGSEAEPPQENATGLPDQLKAGVETLSGFAMDDVRVHYNSAKPAAVQALAYAQGTDIHLGPGQEEHLPHEAWHVAQQKQGRVKPTLQSKGVAINDDAGLEDEADVMGARALAMRHDAEAPTQLFDGGVSRVSPAWHRPAASDLPIQMTKLGTAPLRTAEEYAQWFLATGKDAKQHAQRDIYAQIASDAGKKLSGANALKNAKVIDETDIEELEKQITELKGGKKKKEVIQDVKKLDADIWRHIWRGDFNKDKSRPTGYHWKGARLESWLVGDDDTKSNLFYEEAVMVRSTKVEEIHKATGAAKGVIEGKEKEDKSTFFPDTWEEADVKKAIETRNSAGNIKDKDGKYIDGVALVKSGGTIYPSIQK